MSRGLTIYQAIEKVDELLNAKPQAEKTREELAQENAAAHQALQAMLSGARLP